MGTPYAQCRSTLKEGFECKRQFSSQQIEKKYYQIEGKKEKRELVLTTEHTMYISFTQPPTKTLKKYFKKTSSKQIFTKKTLTFAQSQAEYRQVESKSRCPKLKKVFQPVFATNGVQSCNFVQERRAGDLRLVYRRRHDDAPLSFFLQNRKMGMFCFLQN